MTENKLAHLKVIVVDDDPFQVSIVRRVLGLLGVNQVGEATNGLMTKDLLQSPWDVMLLDLNMPDMDGIELLRVLTEYESPPAVIVFSGEDPRLLETASDLAKNFGLHILGSLPKPISRDRLEEMLHAFSAELPAHTVRAEMIILTEEEIRQGIISGCIELHYQPKVDAGSHQMIGLEALLRWRRQDGSLLGPGSVIPVAEASDLIHVLTKEIFVIAVNQAAQWHAAGKNWKVSCNFSIEDLASPDIVSFVETVISQSGIPPELIILEVTESKLAQDPTLILEQLTRIRLRGIGLSIDDFGTGFSSMEQLRKFPFTELKIDRAFVSGASSQPAARAIFESSVQLAHRLNMVAVAEGAETEQDLLLCGELKVDLIQGYVVARPMPPDQVLAWAVDQNC